MFAHPLFFLITLLIYVAGAAPTYAQETLRILAWEGYTDPAIVSAFSQRHNVKIELTYVISDDDLWNKINTGNFDVFAVNTAELQRYIDKTLVKPIQLEHISNHAQQLPRFQNLQSIPGLMREQNVYAIPYTYSTMGLIYDRKKVKTIPHSMAALWDPNYQGKVLAFNTSNHNFSMSGLLMGVPNPFQMNEKELAQAVKKLVELRRNVLTFYSTAEEAVALYAKHDIALIFGNYGTQQVKALKESGADIDYIIPDEGALTWLDAWAVTYNTPRAALAEQWINYTLEKTVSDHLSTRHGLANTISPLIDIPKEAKIIWIEPLRDPLTRKALWDRIISGDPLESF